jgi:aminodeoxyfutalosine synthase
MPAFDALGLSEIVQKLDRGERLTGDDGVRLFACPDLHALGWLANREREKRHEGRTYYNFNLRLEATNVCVASCLFCSFARLKPGDPEAYTLSLEQVFDKLRARANQPLTEVHIVNGLHPDLPFEYYLDLLRGLKRIRPDVHLKCFTAVEIAFFADIYGMTDEGVLRALIDAGLNSLPGGGAEVFAERVRRKICHDKADADRYLSIHRTAHRLGLRTNVTMLYGHIETMAERVDHMLRTRALQDETGGLQAFIPLAFHPDHNQMRKLPAPSASDTLRVHAVARLMVDNVPHVKAFWIATGVDVAQLSLWYGVDDLDGTVQEEKIYHMAGARTPEIMTTDAIQRLIRAAGREPVERDTLYNTVGTGLFSTDSATRVPGLPESRPDRGNNSAQSVENSPVPLLH